MEKVLVFEKVYFRYENEEVLSDINFEIKEGEVVTIVGPNGGGKTTLLKLILGLIKPSSGRIYLYGNDPVFTRKYVGYLPQFSTVNKNIPIKAFDFVKLAANKENFSSKKTLDYEVDNVLKITDSYHYKDKVIWELSGGQFQRILFARAIVNNPKMLVLDEPTNFIDENSKKNFYEIIESFKGKKTIIIVSHDVSMVSKFSDRIFCLNKRLLITCKKEELHNNLELIYGGFFSYVEHKH
ncbi:MAG: metal ABC transporter ATP-binding protein [bacterium]